MSREADRSEKVKHTDSQILAIYKDLGIDISKFPANESPIDTATKINSMRYDAIKMTVSFSADSEIQAQVRR